MKSKVFIRVVCLVLAVMLILSVFVVAASSVTANAAEISTSTVSQTPQQGTKGYVNDDYVNLRSGAGTSYSVVETLRINTEFTFADGKDYSGWYKITLDSGKTGYIYSEYATAFPADSYNAGTVTGDFVNLRSGAGTSYSVVKTLVMGTEFMLVSTSLYNNDWYNIELSDGTKGYIHKDYVSLKTVTLSKGYVFAKYSPLKKGAGDEHRTLKLLKKNDEFTFVSEKTENTYWYKVKLSDGTEGYLHRGEVMSSKPSQTASAYAIQNDTQLCSNADGKLLRLLPSQTELTITDDLLYNAQWYSVKLSDGTQGYVNRNDITFTRSLCAVAENRIGYVSVQRSVLRSGAGTSYSSVAELFKGASFTFVDSKLYSSSWCKVKINDGKEGYINKNEISLNSPATIKASVTADNAQIYTGAGEKYTKLTTLAKNTAVMLVSEKIYNNQWYHIELSDGKTGYIKESALKVEQPATVPQPTTQPPTQPITDLKISSTSVSLYKGNYTTLSLTPNVSATWTSSNTSVATVKNGLVYAAGNGTADIKATAGGKTVSCKVTVTTGSYVGISESSVNTNAGRSVMLSSDTYGAYWKSSDTSIAEVSRGVVATKKAGTVVISAYTSYGSSSCVMTVGAEDNIRFAFSEPNTAPLNGTVTLKAITDLNKTAVQFKVTNGNTTYTVDASSKVKDGSTYVWSGNVKLTISGEWKIKAYSKTSSSNTFNTTPDFGESTVFVTKSTDTVTTTCEERRASDSVIKLIANFEGFLPELTDDYITGDPTIGYGRVIFPGEQFYNNLTMNEAYGYLCQTVNEGGYTSRTNSFLISNGIKFNQRQFDALVCFAYNVGAYAILNDSDLQSVLLNTGTGSAPTQIKSGAEGYVNDDGVNLRSGAGTSNSIVTTMSAYTKFTFVDGKLYNNSWYKIKLSNGTEGYIYSDYASLSSGSQGRDLNNTSKQSYANNFFAYHHAAGSCYWGLLARRVDEGEIFFYGDYIRDGYDNKYGFVYSCQTYGGMTI